MTEELRDVGNMILSPGGGWVTDPSVVGLLRPPGQLIYLRARPEVVVKRLGNKVADRPLLMRPDPLGELVKLLAERKQAYESADHVVDTELHDLQGVIKQVTELARRAV